VLVGHGAATHPGLVRSNNEDMYLVVHYGRYLQTLQTNVPAGHILDRYDAEGYGLLVADGVGGHAGGEVASRLAVTSLVHLVLDTPDWVLLIGEEEQERSAERTRRWYHQVDAVLRAEAGADPSLAGMGTTLTVARNLGPLLILAHVGDSRAYLLRDGVLFQLTRDHTLSQDLADAGGLAPAEVATHVFRHVLTRALGGPKHWKGVDIRFVELHDADQVLLCTDGLTDMVDDEAIAATLRKATTAADACQALVDRALANGGRDNVTAVLARYRIAAAT
jgi:protein phosphatase